MAAALPVVSIDLPAELGSPAAVRAVLGAVARSCAAVRLSETDLAELSVVVHEACVNVIEHALKGDGERRFRVELHCHTNAMEIVVEDASDPYTLPEHGLPDPQALDARGYGLHIMRTWSDRLRLERRGSVNRLSVLRHYRESAREHR